MALFVEFEEAGEDFVAEVVGPAETPGLFLFGLLRAGFVVVFFLVVQQELAASRFGRGRPSRKPPAPLDLSQRGSSRSS